MERQLKERVVGAVLLVLAAVLIIPLFLDGPDPGSDEARRSVALPPAEDTDVRTRTVRLEQSRDTPTAPPMSAEPVPSASSPPEATGPAAQGAAADQPAAAEPGPQPDSAPTAQPEPRAPAAPATQPAPPASASLAAPAAATPDSGSWVVQLGSFGSRDNAERLAEELRGKRYQSFVTRLDADGRTLHRVRVGPGGAREEADRLIERLRADGYNSGQAVPE